MTFAYYFLKKQLFENSIILEENTNVQDKYIKKLYEKFPNVQYKDIEEAIEGEDNRKNIEKKLFKINKKKRNIKKTLNCPKAIRSCDNQDELTILVKRAEKILTNQEVKILQLCAKGNSVRKIAQEINLSFSTTWRNLNSALDKIRVSNGIKARKLG